MQENHVPNASIPPSNQPSNSPEPHKSNTGLIIAIVAIVIAFGLQFIAPFFMLVLFSTSLRDIVGEIEDGWEWTYGGYDDVTEGSPNYSGNWTSDQLSLSFNGVIYQWSEIIDEQNSVYESGNYVALAADDALEYAEITEEQAAQLLGREDDFDLDSFYVIDLMVTDKDEKTSDEMAMSHQILFYHLNYYHAKVYDMATKKSYDLTWTAPQQNAPNTLEQDGQGNRT